jgi:hypothetical protein
MKKKRASRKDGYVFTEILVALIITAVAFALVLGAIAHSASAAHTIGRTVKEVILERNSYVENRTTVFQVDSQ